MLNAHIVEWYGEAAGVGAWLCVFWDEKHELTFEHLGLVTIYN